MLHPKNRDKKRAPTRFHVLNKLGGAYGCCSTVVLMCFTCPAITVGTVILRALDRVRERPWGERPWGERALGCFVGHWCVLHWLCVLPAVFMHACRVGARSPVGADAD